MPTFDIRGVEIRDRVGLRELIEAVFDELWQLPGADPTMFARVTLSPKRVGAIHGKCRYPRPARGRGPGAELARQGYVITAAVRNDRHAYPTAIAHWGALLAPRTKQGWRSGPVLYRFQTMNAAAGFVLAHELAHVALRQKWMPVKNTEAVTNALALHWCRRIGLDVETRTDRPGDRVLPPPTVLGLERSTQLWLW